MVAVVVDLGAVVPGAPVALCLPVLVKASGKGAEIKIVIAIKLTMYNE
jgi:hypothetical protein